MQRPSASTGHQSRNLETKMKRMHSPPVMDIPPPETTQCKTCGRFFNLDRINKHQHVCRMAMKERPVFDAGQHRVRGTEAEKYYKPLSMRNPKTNMLAGPSGVKGSNWRKKHEEFLTTIREAREVQAHLERGGKFSELPPSKPTENLDYIECPHCGRKFNETAARRHIPKCAKMIHNKAKVFGMRK